MVIYGIALLGICTLLGLLLGDWLGLIFGVDANVGGIGIAMLLLMYFSNTSTTKFNLGKFYTEAGFPKEQVDEWDNPELREPVEGDNELKLWLVDYGLSFLEGNLYQHPHR